MKKLTKITLIIAAACTLLGIIFVAIAFVFGAATGFAIDSKGNYIDYGSEKVYELDKTIVEGDITNIELNSSYGDVILCDSEDDNVYVEYYYNQVGDSSREPEYGVDNGTFTFKDPRNTGSNFIINFSFFNSTKDSENYVKLYIPSSVTYENVNIDTDLGDVTCDDLNGKDVVINNNSGDINCKNITCETITITDDLGDVELDNITADTIDVINNSGDINCTNITSNELSIEDDLGNIYLDKVICEENISITNSSGDIDINNIESTDVSIEDDLGNITMIGIDISNGTITNSSGDITIEDGSVETLNVKGDLGDIELYLKGELSDYDYTLETDLGDVEVNEKDEGSKGEVINNSKNLIEVSNDCGDIKLDIK